MAHSSNVCQGYASRGETCPFCAEYEARQWRARVLLAELEVLLPALDAPLAMSIGPEPAGLTVGDALDLLLRAARRA